MLIPNHGKNDGHRFVGKGTIRSNRDTRGFYGQYNGFVSTPRGVFRSYRSIEGFITCQLNYENRIQGDHHAGFRRLVYSVVGRFLALPASALMLAGKCASTRWSNKALRENGCGGISTSRTLLCGLRSRDYRQTKV